MRNDTRVVHVKDNVPGAVYIGRTNGRYGLAESMLANHFHITGWRPRSVAIRAFEDWIMRALAIDDDLSGKLRKALIDCRGKPLACWCRHDGEPKTTNNACHGDVIVNLLNLWTDDELRRQSPDS